MAISLFSSTFYSYANPDLAAAGLKFEEQLLSHFQNNGLNEGRPFSPFVDLNFYRSSNPDLVAAGLTRNDQLLNHLENTGVAEGRLFSPFVDINFVLTANPDLNEAYRGSREQVLFYLAVGGVEEGRFLSPFVDLEEYLKINPDVYQAFGADLLQAFFHLQLTGIREGRQFDPFVNLDYYLTANPDVNAAFGGDRKAAFEHLATAGIAEGRQFSASFNINFYRANNPDLTTAGLNTNRLAYGHWAVSGAGEYRSGIADPGSSVNNALNIGTLGINRQATFTGTINSLDTDVYRFTVNQPTAIFASLEFQTGDGELELINANNTAVIISSTTLSTNSEAVSTLLAPGTYYIRAVTFVPSGSISHILTLRTFVPQSGSDLAANSRINAVPFFSQPSGLTVVKDSLTANGDRDDFYRIELLDDASVNIRLADLVQNADLFLLDSGGGEIASSENAVSSNENIVTILSAGTYYVQVNLVGTLTGYTLEWDTILAPVS